MAMAMLRCVFLIVLTVFALQASATRKLIQNTISKSERHELWMLLHGRVYKDDAEKAHRLSIFKSNMEHIESFNDAGNHKFKLGANEFADLSPDEFYKICSGFHPPSLMTTVGAAKGFMYHNVSDVPSSVDWRAEGAVTPVKHQGRHCGSCWAFSAVAAVEGINKLKTGELISLSEQELLDCDMGNENKGCDGGQMSKAFEFIVNNEGLSAELNYKYNGLEATNTCNRKLSFSHPARIRGYEDVPANNEDALLKAVSNQPVSVAIDAGSYAFLFYSGGVFTGPCGTDLNHGVTIVGYGAESDGTKYWIVKNSWGSSWGENGYIKMLRGATDQAAGLCGIAMQASYPIA